MIFQIKKSFNNYRQIIQNNRFACKKQRETYKLFPLYKIIIFLFIYLPVINAQQKAVINGIITDISGEVLAGANIQIKSLAIGTVSDTNGFYSLNLPPEINREQELELVAQYMGYKTEAKKITINNTITTIHFKLKEDLFQSEAIVVTGIASKTAKQYTAISVSRVDAIKYTESYSYQSVSQLLTGKVAGIQIKSASGNTGGGFRFFMRSGAGLIGDGQPIIYIDGIRVDNSGIAGRYTAGGQDMSILANLNPQDIEKIDVLKGPAGAASYGTSGSNGAVLITTKKGTRDLAIHYKYLLGFNTQAYSYKTDDYFSADHANAIFRNGTIREQYITLSGGQNNLRYYTSFDYRKEEGILQSDQMNRKTFRINLTASPYNNLRIGINTGYIENKIYRPQNDNNGFGYLANTLSSPVPYIYTDSVSIARIKDINSNNQFTGSFQLYYNPIKSLDANLTIGIDTYNWDQDQIFPKNFEYSIFPDGAKSIYNRYNRMVTYDFNIKYQYRIIPSLQVTSIIGTQCIDDRLNTSYMRAEEFGTETIQNIGSGKKISDWGEQLSINREAGIFTDHSFSFKDLYFLSLGLRKDYGSSHNDNAPSIYYPTARLAVRLDRYKNFPSLFNLMKFRLAYGETGILPPAYRQIPFLWRSAIGGYGVGAVLASIGNPNIKPERIREFEVGIDTEIFNRYSVELTCYYQNSTDCMVPKNLAPSTGMTATGILYNIGEINGWGIETLLNASPIRDSKYQLDLSLILNYQTNKIVDLGGSPPFYDGYGINVLKDNFSRHEFYTYKVLGAEFDSNGEVILDSDNRNILVKHTKSRVKMGNPIPVFTGSNSVNFRFNQNLETYIMCDWALGHKIFNKTKQWATLNGNNVEHDHLANQLGIINLDPSIDRLYPNTSEYRKAADKYAKMNPSYSGNFIEDADFLKIREIGLSYSLKNYFRQPIIKDVILGISIRNIFTFTKYSGPDPEVNADGSRSDLSRGIDFFTLQSPRVYNIWLKLSL